ncbi:transposase IS4 family protein, partial [Candidatus Omnitrophus magneticus]
MYLKCRRRFKDGKEHRYFSIVESIRTRRGVIKRQVLYLGEINDSQEASWCKALEVFDKSDKTYRQLSIFTDDINPPDKVTNPIQIKLNEMRLERPREWGACWLALEMWHFLGLDNFWSKHLRPCRYWSNWLNVVISIVEYCFISSGSAWLLIRQWFKSSAMADLLGEDDSIALDDTLYRCLDLLHAPKKDLFSFLSERWKTLFNISYDVLLYDLTSTYFEADSKDNERLKKFGYSRDKRSDCVQVVIALIVTKEGFPVAYEVMPGNTQDRTTLPEFLKKIETVYGKLNRLWIMDRGIPTEESLKKMREHNADYLVGTPRGKLSKLEKQLLKEPWKKVQENVKVKLIREEKELYILTFSNGRRDKERSMRQRRLRNLYERLK